MKGLQKGAGFPFCEYDQCVDNFVEFGEVEQPSVISKAFIPHSTNIRRVWVKTGEFDGFIGDSPSACGRVVRSGIAQSSGSMHLAHSVCHPSQSMLPFDARPGVPRRMDHSGAGPC